MSLTVIFRSSAAGGTTSVVDAGNIASAEAFGADTFTDHVALVGAGGIASAEAFGADTFTDHVAVAGASGIASAEAFGQPTVSSTGAPVQQQPVLGGGWGRPVFYTGKRREIVVPGLDRPAIRIEHQVVGAGGIPSEEAFGSPTVTSRRSAQRRRREEEALLAA
jgi:hypothetical protein